MIRINTDFQKSLVCIILNVPATDEDRIMIHLL